MTDSNVIDLTKVKRDPENPNILIFNPNDPGSMALAHQLAPQNYAAFLDMRASSKRPLFAEPMKNLNFDELRINRQALF